MSEVVIRPREARDLYALARALVAVHEVDGYPVEGVADPVGWLAFTDPLGVWVAEVDGAVVGHVALLHPTADDSAATLWMRHSGAQLHDIAVLARLFAAPAGRGLGLGRALTATATAWADQLGRRAVLDVMDKDTAAIRTYTRLGWMPLGPVDHHHPGGTTPATAYVSPEHPSTFGR